MLAELFARIEALFRRRQLDDDLDQELQSHLDLLTDEHLRRGLSPEEARRAARLKIGGIPSLKERHREIRGFPVIETVWQDVKFAVRLIFKDRWISAAAITALALGIGVNAVGFTIVNTAFFAACRSPILTSSSRPAGSAGKASSAACRASNLTSGALRIPRYPPLPL
jgi:hypothetical protein